MSYGEVPGISKEEVEFCHLRKNAKCENGVLDLTDVEIRRCRDRMGFGTPVVCTVNHKCSLLIKKYIKIGDIANALNTSPGDYDRKVKT